MNSFTALLEAFRHHYPDYRVQTRIVQGSPPEGYVVIKASVIDLTNSVMMSAHASAGGEIAEQDYVRMADRDAAREVMSRMVAMVATPEDDTEEDPFVPPAAPAIPERLPADAPGDPVPAPTPEPAPEVPGEATESGKKTSTVRKPPVKDVDNGAPEDPLRDRAKAAFRAAAIRAGVPEEALHNGKLFAKMRHFLCPDLDNMKFQAWTANEWAAMHQALADMLQVPGADPQALTEMLKTLNTPGG